MQAEYFPILSFVVDKLKTKDNILEIGIDIFSIFFFDREFKEIEILETVEQNLVTKIDLDKVSSRFYQIDDAVDYLHNVNKKKYDCVFINTNEKSIWKFINELYNKSDVIIIFNTEKNDYNWYLVEKPLNFVWLDIKMFNPWTSVVTSNRELIRALTVKFQTTIRNNIDYK